MISSYFGPCHQVNETSSETQNCTPFLITIRILYLFPTSICYHRNFVADLDYIGFRNKNKILMNSKEYQTVYQTSYVPTQTIFIMLSYIDYDTQAINEESDETDSQINKTDSQSQGDDLDTTFHATE